MEVFQNYAYYYNAFYKEKNYKKEAEQIDYLLKKYDRRIRNIINFGCGTGKHDVELCNLGYWCTGVDISELMIDIARENAEKMEKNIEFKVADIRDYEPQNTYDAVISLFHVMSYQNTNEDILSALTTARRALDVGGILLFDVWYGPGVLSDKPELRIREVEDEINKLVRIAKPTMHEQRNVVDVCYEVYIINKINNKIETIQEVHSMRYFFRPEMEKYLQDAGFELLDNLDCNTLDDTSFDSWTSYFVARAK